MGGKGDELGACCCCCCCCCCGAGEREASGTEVLADPIDVTTGAGVCHALPACPSVDGGATDC